MSEVARESPFLVPVRPEDESFLFDLYAQTRSEEVAGWGWSDAQQRDFLQMQFRIQRQGYALQYPSASWWIVRHRGASVGRLVVDRSIDALRLVDVAVLTEWRGQGLGTWLVRNLQAEAARERKPLRLSVAVDNPAQRLYQRLGFQVDRGSATHVAMLWCATAGAPIDEAGEACVSR